MTSFVTDSFTGTDSAAITAHTGELGATWTRHSSATNAGAPIILGNELVSTEAGTNENYYASGTPSSADYTVSLDITKNGTGYSEIAGPAARLQTAENSGYFFFSFYSYSGVCLFKYVSGTLTQLGATVSFTPSDSVVYRLTLDVAGTTIKGRLQRLSDSQWLNSSAAFQSEQTDCIVVTDSSISSAGRSGFWLAHTLGSTIRTKINNFSADQAGGGGGGATATTLTGPSSGTSGIASTNFTVGANGTITGTVTVTPSDSSGGGTFTPSSVAISSGTPTATFTYTPASVGSKTISISDNGGLTDAASVSYTASAATIYDRVDTTDALTGQNIMILVPNSNAAVPYNSSNATGIIIYVHGAGEDHTGLVSESLKFECRDALINAGYILAGSSAHGTANWGNQASVDDYAGLDHYLRLNYNVKNVALWGQSMGGLDALSVVAQHKFSVVGCLLTYPVCSLAALHATWATSAINAAHGVTGSGIYTYANQTYGMDPILKHAEDFGSVPMRFYASPSDTVVEKLTNTDAFQSIVANTRTEATIVACSGDHGDASHFASAEYVAFFNRCFGASLRAVSVNLVNANNSAQASLTGLKWAFFEQDNIGSLSLAPVAIGTAETTDGSGNLVIQVTTKLQSGSVGWLIVTDSDGNPATAHKAFSGPVAVS